MKPIHEVWVSTDSCQEHWGWEDIEELDPRVKIPTDPSAHRYIYTSDQLKQAKVEAIYAASCFCVNEADRQRMSTFADEIERSKT
jgi:hypothetical protein